MCNVWGQTIKAANPFMTQQAHGIRYEFFGLDFVCDVMGGCWLLEVNRYCTCHVLVGSCEVTSVLWLQVARFGKLQIEYCCRGYFI